MSNAFKSLPPMGSLIGFEAAARLGSFSAAAQELQVTQSAISHQVRVLEEHLGQPLFARVARRVELTDAGRDWQATTATVLDTLRHGARRLDAYTKPSSAVLHLPHPFAQAWFLPRLAQFQEDCPGVEPWLYSDEAEVDLFEAEIDITLSTRPSGEADVRKHRFCRAHRQAYCAPSLIGMGMEAVPLLHDEHPDDWVKWFSVSGVPRDQIMGGLNFSNEALAVDAAVRGLGACLANPVLAEGAVLEGKLVAVSDVVLRSGEDYVLSVRQQNLQRHAVKHLWDWLVRAAPANGRKAK